MEIKTEFKKLGAAYIVGNDIRNWAISLYLIHFQVIKLVEVVFWSKLRRPAHKMSNVLYYCFSLLVNLRKMLTLQHTVS